jgi:Family of unknown function (DUF5681)
MGSNVIAGSKGKRRTRPVAASADASAQAPPATEERPTRAQAADDPTLTLERQASPGEATALSGDRVYVPQPHGGALTPWPPGTSGNPGGKPRRLRPSDWVAECMALSVAELRRDPGPDEPAGRAMCRAWLLSGVEGDVRACETLADRAEGKPTQRVELDVAVLKAFDVTATPDDL